jgi:hypothetical protein
MVVLKADQPRDQDQVAVTGTGAPVTVAEACRDRLTFTLQGQEGRPVRARGRITDFAGARLAEICPDPLVAGSPERRTDPLLEPGRHGRRIRLMPIPRS